MPKKTLSDKLKSRGERLAKRIQASRSASGLTQAELASKVGISLDTLRSIESGRTSTPNVFLVADLAEHLDEELTKWLK
jgi:DNA-binding XRE family transcriptional regulator